MWFRALVNIPFAAFVLVPLSLLRDMSSLAFASMLSLMSLTYVMLVMIIELPWYNKVYRDEPNLSI
jgi:amino acid permease